MDRAATWNVAENGQKKKTSAHVFQEQKPGMQRRQRRVLSVELRHGPVLQGPGESRWVPRDVHAVRLLGTRQSRVLLLESARDREQDAEGDRRALRQENRNCSQTGEAARDRVGRGVGRHTKRLTHVSRTRRVVQKRTYTFRKTSFFPQTFLPKGSHSLPDSNYTFLTLLCFFSKQTI